MDAALREHSPGGESPGVESPAGGFVYPGAGAPHLVFRCLPAVLERATAATTLPVAESSVVREAARARGGGGGGVVVELAGSVRRFARGLRFPGLGPGGFCRVSRGSGDERARRGHAREAAAVRRRWIPRPARAVARSAWAWTPSTSCPCAASGCQGTNTCQYGALLALAQRDDRVILTKDRRLLQRKDAVAAFLVEDDDPKRQLARVSAHFGLRYRRGKLLTRCAGCNGAVERRCTPEEVAANGAIPAKVKASTNEFWACGRCEKVYWVGPKSHLAMWPSTRKLRRR